MKSMKGDKNMAEPEKNGRDTSRMEQLRNAWTQTEEVILKRRSVRIYQKKQVPEFMIKRILEAGRFAPSAGNGQPWKFIVLRDLEIIDGITRTTVQACKKISTLLDYRHKKSSLRRGLASLLTRFKPNDLHPVPFGAATLVAREKLGLFHHAPTVILIFADIRGIGLPALDCGIAAQNMALAAHSMGLGTCYVGFPKLAFESTGVWKKKLDIGYPYSFVTSLAVGFPVGQPDGFVARATHAVDWYENGNKQTLY